MSQKDPSPMWQPQVIGIKVGNRYWQQADRKHLLSGLNNPRGYPLISAFKKWNKMGILPNSLYVVLWWTGHACLWHLCLLRTWPGLFGLSWGRHSASLLSSLGHTLLLHVAYVGNWQPGRTATAVPPHQERLIVSVVACYITPLWRDSAISPVLHRGRLHHRARRWIPSHPPETQRALHRRRLRCVLHYWALQHHTGEGPFVLFYRLLTFVSTIWGNISTFLCFVWINSLPWFSWNSPRLYNLCSG